MNIRDLIDILVLIYLCVTTGFFFVAGCFAFANNIFFSCVHFLIAFNMVLLSIYWCAKVVEKAKERRKK